MANDETSSPRLFPGVAVSSTFTDLEKHRAVLIQALNGEELFELATENDSAKLVDVIDSSLRKVRDGSAYIGVIGQKYGQTPPCTRRNPDELSITELEFNEALRLNRPILLFIMGDKHPVTKADVETDAGKIAKLNAFRERAKQMRDSKVHRVYATFESLDEFTKEAFQSVAELHRNLDALVPRAAIPQPATADPIPAPPGLLRRAALHRHS